MSKVRVGLSGWSYDAWQGDFFPADLPHDRRLAFVAERFDTVEANGPFYSLLTPPAYRSWYEGTLGGFRFAVKGSRFITHNKKLSDVRRPLANFLASGILELGEKLGPILWQLPARHAFDAERLEGFLSLLPKDTDSASRLAAEHDARVSDVSLSTDANHRIRQVLEVRHESFFCDAAVRLLRNAGVALAISRSGDWPVREELTAGFVYVRLHGAPWTYRSGYGAGTLDGWAAKIEEWAAGGEPGDTLAITDRRPPARKGRDVYVYFDNDAEGRAPRDAGALRDRLDG